MCVLGAQRARSDDFPVRIEPCERPIMFGADAHGGPFALAPHPDDEIAWSEFRQPHSIILFNDDPGQPVAAVGPLQQPPAKSFTAVISYAVMRPGDRSMVHTHPDPEGWYMIAGEQSYRRSSALQVLKCENRWLL
jgi:hypothetical protein